MSGFGKPSDKSDNGTRRVSRTLSLTFAVSGIVLVAAIAGVLFDRYGPRGSSWGPVFPDSDDLSASPSMDNIVASNQAVAAEKTMSRNSANVSHPRQAKPATRPAMPMAVASQPSAPDTPAEVIQEAKRLTDFVVTALPEIPDTLELCARIRLWLGDSDGAVDAWQESLDQWPQYAYAYHGMGTVAAEKGDSGKAIQLYRRAIELEPTLSEARRDLARALLDDGQAERAVSVLKEYVPRNPQRADGYASLGFAYQQLGDSQHARESYEAALERDPNHTRAVYGLATACARLGLTEESQANSARFREMLAAEGEVRRDERSSYDDVSALCEDLGGFYTDAGRIFFSQGQAPVAEMLCRRAVVVCPGQTECRQALALMCRRQGRLPEAIGWLEELGRSADDPETYYVEIGRLQIELGRWKEAEAAFRHARRHAPRNLDACTSLVRLFLRRGVNSNEAVVLAEAAVKLRPSAENYALLGTARQSAGDKAGAIDALQRAVDIAPEVDDFRRLLKSLTQQ